MQVSIMSGNRATPLACDKQAIEVLDPENILATSDGTTDMPWIFRPWGEPTSAWEKDQELASGHSVTDGRETTGM